MQPDRQLVKARDRLAPAPRSALQLHFDPDREEAELFAIAEAVVSRAGSTIDDALRSGPCRERLRARLESAIASGRWARSRRLVRECVHRGAHIALLIARREGRALDESLVEVTCRVIECNRSLIALRLRFEDLRERSTREVGSHG